MAVVRQSHHLHQRNLQLRRRQRFAPRLEGGEARSGGLARGRRERPVERHRPGEIIEILALRLERGVWRGVIAVGRAPMKIEHEGENEARSRDAYGADCAAEDECQSAQRAHGHATLHRGSELASRPAAEYARLVGAHRHVTTQTTDTRRPRCGAGLRSGTAHAPGPVRAHRLDLPHRPAVGRVRRERRNDVAGSRCHSYGPDPAGGAGTLGRQPVSVHRAPRDRALCDVRHGTQPRALAAYVGAPVEPDAHCKANVQIVFTSKPREKMDDVVQWATAAFGIRYSGGQRDLIAYRGDHAIQGFYITTRGGASVLNTDLALVGLDVQPVWPQVEEKYLGRGRLGTRLGGGSGSGIGIGMVILVVDTTRAAGYTIATLADALAMLTLSVAQSPDHCDPLPSILDLMSSSCGTRDQPAAMTAGDLAFLKALYYLNTGLGPSLSRAQIQDNMTRQLAQR